MEHDLTVVWYSANIISDYFMKNTQKQLLKAIEGLPLISVSKKPTDFGDNIWVGDLPCNHLNIYRQALIGAKTATTKFIALAEDDVLYSPEHFKHRSNSGKFAYNLGAWSIFTWSDPIFTCKMNGRINLSGLICERKLFIEAMEERFSTWPDDERINLGIWAEPSKYERQLKVTVREAETFYTNPPNIVFSHNKALSFDNLGTRKAMGQIRATEIPIWGSAKKIRALYE